MRRKEMIEFLEKAIEEMDVVDEATLRNGETGEVIDVIGKHEIEAMQCALVFCKHLVIGDYNPQRPLSFIHSMIDTHGNCKREWAQKKADELAADELARHEASDE